MSDQLEQEILSKGLTTGPRVSNGQVEALMSTLKYETWVVPGTATTVAVAILPIGNINWTVATQYASAVSIENFDAELGKSVAIKKAAATAKKKLWELEGYALAKAIASDLGIFVQLSEEDIAVLKANDVWLGVKSEIDKISGLSKLAMDAHHIVSRVLAHLGKPDFVDGPIPIKIPRKHIIDMVGDEKFQDMVDAFEESILELTHIESTIPRIFLAVTSALKTAVA